MSHLFECLRYYIHTNIAHIIKTRNSYNFCTNVRKTVFAQNLYEFMNHGKFVMLVIVWIYHPSNTPYTSSFV
jgi:hypothetical protein